MIICSQYFEYNWTQIQAANKYPLPHNRLKWLLLKGISSLSIQHSNITSCKLQRWQLELTFTQKSLTWQLPRRKSSFRTMIDCGMRILVVILSFQRYMAEMVCIHDSIDDNPVIMRRIMIKFIYMCKCIFEKYKKWNICKLNIFLTIHITRFLPKLS